jgi:N-acetyl sugar amidotransferase
MIREDRLNVVFIVHYFPPINSAGAKRVEALSKYFALAGHCVTVITTTKTSADGAFTEPYPKGVSVLELDALGRDRPSHFTNERYEPMNSTNPSWKRKIKDAAMELLGQVPDPRLPFALMFAAPWLSKKAVKALADADVVVGSSPPWPTLLAAIISKVRFGVPCVLDYRDQFSECHEMPGGTFARWLERTADTWLTKHADHVVTISAPMTGYYREFSTRVSTILNGFDEEALDAAKGCARPHSDDRIRIRYLGVVSPGRVPHNFLQALEKLRETHPDRFARIDVEFFGPSAEPVRDALRARYPSIAGSFSFNPPIAYSAALREMVESDFLLFAETSSRATASAQGILPTKLFEYLGAGRPIFADISETSLAGATIAAASPRHVVGNTVEVFTDSLQASSFDSRPAPVPSESAFRFSRKSQAREYSTLLQGLARGHERLGVRPYQVCTNCVIDTSDVDVTFDERGRCDFCNNFYHNILPHWDTGPAGAAELGRIVDQIRKDGHGKAHDCIIGISGGVDSSYLTYLAKEKFGLRPLVFHVDAGWNSQQATNNIEKLVEALDLDLHTQVVDWEAMKDLQRAFFKAQVPHQDVPQDHAFFASLYNYAAEHGFKYILTGGNLSTECLREPLEWAYHASDLRQIRDIHRKFGARSLEGYPTCDIFRYKIYYRYVKGVRVVRPLDYIPYFKEAAMQELVERFGWQRYAHKHYESRFTRFFEGYWLPTKFGYDKRRVHFSSLILTGQMTRDDALARLAQPAYDPETIGDDFEYVATKLDLTVDELRSLMNGPNRDYRSFQNNMWLIELGNRTLRMAGVQRVIIR